MYQEISPSRIFWRASLDELIGRWAKSVKRVKAKGDFTVRAGIIRPVLDRTILQNNLNCRMASVAGLISTRHQARQAQ